VAQSSQALQSHQATEMAQLKHGTSRRLQKMTTRRNMKKKQKRRQKRETKLRYGPCQKIPPPPLLAQLLVTHNRSLLHRPQLHSLLSALLQKPLLFLLLQIQVQVQVQVLFLLFRSDQNPARQQVHRLRP
jgi:hypothetical protein